jgi:ribosomal-protein-alanine N-acetyltransferase
METLLKEEARKINIELTDYMIEQFMKYKELLKEWVPQYKNNNYYHWAIELKGTKEIIGSIAIVDIDEEKENMEIGYCIGEQWWNNGYMTEAVKEVIEFLFKEVNIKTITGKADSRNKASIKVLTKCGLKYRRVENKQNKNEDIEVLVYTKAN